MAIKTVPEDIYEEVRSVACRLLKKQEKLDLIGKVNRLQNKQKNLIQIVNMLSSEDQVQLLLKLRRATATFVMETIG